MSSTTSDPNDTIRVKGPCPTVEQLIRGASGELPAAERDRIVRHVNLCPDCLATWKSAGGPDPSATSPQGTTPPPQAKRSPVPALLIGTFVLLLVAGAVSVVVIARYATRLGSGLLGRATQPVTTATSTTRVTTTTSTTTMPTLSPDSLQRQMGDIGRTMGQMHETNVEFRRRVMMRPRPQLPPGPHYELYPAAAGAAAVPIRRVAGGPFSVVLHLPANAAKVAVDDASGAMIWGRPAGSTPTVRINFPAGSLPAGSFRARALDPTGNVAALYPFEVIDAR